MQGEFLHMELIITPTAASQLSFSLRSCAPTPCFISSCHLRFISLINLEV